MNTNPQAHVFYDGRSIDINLSDIDVGVVFPIGMSLDMQESRIEEIRNGLEKKFGGRDKADVINVSMTKSPLLRYIITLGEGVVLFADDRESLNNLANYALRDYEDTRPLRAIQRNTLSRLFA